MLSSNSLINFFLSALTNVLVNVLLTVVNANIIVTC